MKGRGGLAGDFFVQKPNHHNYTFAKDFSGALLFNVYIFFDMLEG